MGKTIIVSGGTKGIGKAIIIKFASEKFNIITCSRNQDELNDLQRQLSLQFPTIQIFIFQADLAIQEEVFKFINFIKSLNLSIDILVNNAGRFIQGTLHEEALGNLENMINTNLYSAYHLSRGIIPQMILQKFGYIFNICSTASIIPYTNGGSYCISKFALYGMSKVLREEMKPFGVKVTSVLPGATKTASWDGVDLPEERFVKAVDIADTIWGIFNLSPNADVEEILIRPQLGDL